MDCKRCGKCCRDNLITINNSEYKFLSGSYPLLKDHIKDFKSSKVIVDCPFLEKDNSCSIYSKRPSICKLFPFVIKGDQSEESYNSSIIKEFLGEKI